MLGKNVNFSCNQLIYFIIIISISYVQLVVVHIVYFKYLEYLFALLHIRRRTQFVHDSKATALLVLVADFSVC